MEWIKIKDTRPPVNQMVLLYGNKILSTTTQEITIGRLLPNGILMHGLSEPYYRDNYYVTHWMLLPNLPNT